MNLPFFPSMTFTDPEQGFEGCINSASDVDTLGSIRSNTIHSFLLHSLDRWPPAGLSNQVTTTLLQWQKSCRLLAFQTHLLLSFLLMTQRMVKFLILARQEIEFLCVEKFKHVLRQCDILSLYGLD